MKNLLPRDTKASLTGPLITHNGIVPAHHFRVREVQDQLARVLYQLPDSFHRIFWRHMNTEKKEVVEI